MSDATIADLRGWLRERAGDDESRAAIDSATDDQISMWFTNAWDAEHPEAFHPVPAIAVTPDPFRDRRIARAEAKRGRKAALRKLSCS